MGKFKWCPDLAKLVPNNTAEEGVALDLGSTTMLASFIANAMFHVAQEAE
jgi:hypothetical protein